MNKARGGGLDLEVEAVEQSEALAFYRGDVAALDALWADELLVNSTTNLIANKEVLLNLIRRGGLRVKSFDRRTQRIAVVGEMMVATGNETSELAAVDAGLLLCSYMNIWRKLNGGLRLYARHVGLIDRVRRKPD